METVDICMLSNSHSVQIWKKYSYHVYIVSVAKKGQAVFHIWEPTTLFGCDWDLLFTSYTCQVHFIHIKGVWHTLYAVDGHKDATPTCMAMARAWLCVTSGN